MEVKMTKKELKEMAKYCEYDCDSCVDCQHRIICDHLTCKYKVKKPFVWSKKDIKMLRLRMKHRYYLRVDADFDDCYLHMNGFDITLTEMAIDKLEINETVIVEYENYLNVYKVVSIEWDGNSHAIRKVELRGTRSYKLNDGGEL